MPNVAFFMGSGGAGGSGLWLTDGTPEGTRLLSSAIASAAQFTPFRDGRVIFAADDRINGTELWITDGTAAGTRLLRDIHPGFGEASAPAGFIGLGDGRLAFSADNGTSSGGGRELWVTDGTTAGTRLLADIASIGSSDPRDLTALGGGRVIFSAAGGGGREPWVTDGTLAGTFRLRDINAERGSDPNQLTPIGGGRALFVADDGLRGRELWVTNGTEAGTFLLRDIWPGRNSSQVSSITPIGGGRAIFVASDGTTGFEPWITDGTSFGTRLLKDIAPFGVAGSEPREFTAIGGGRFLFSAAEHINGRELWVTDGTEAGTVLVRNIAFSDLDSRPTRFIPLGDGRALFVAAYNGSTWVSDGTAEGTVQLRGLAGNSARADWGAPLGDGRAVAAGASAAGLELWVTDGTPDGTRLLADIVAGPASSTPQGFRVLAPGLVLFEAFDGAAVGLWVTDGSAAGTRPLDAALLGSLTVAFLNAPPRPGRALPSPVVDPGDVLSLTLPPDLFLDPDVPGRDRLTLSVRLADGGGLPAWLSFDAGARTLSGTVPDGASPRLVLRVTATDTFGASAATEFALSIRAVLTGTAGDDTLVAPNGRLNRITGLTGDDLILGGDQSDIIDAGPGADDVFAGAGDDRVQGGDGDDELWGQEGDDEILGEAGNDLLIGGPGDDTLDGGTGSDTASYETAPGPVFVDLRLTIRQDTRGAGNDLLIGLENLRGSRFADRLIGDAGPNVLEGGAGRDRLEGGAGNDRLDGGPDRDVLRGGTGNDTYVVDHEQDRVIEAAGAGTDTVFASVSFALPANVENLTLTGSAALNGAGNGLGNRLRGNDGPNGLTGGGGKDQIDGGAGDDTLLGGADADTLTGGPGRDVFAYTAIADSRPATTQRDTITDFRPGEDLISLVAIDADETTPGKQGFVFIGSAAFSAPGQVRTRLAGSDIVVEANVNADLAADFAILLQGRPSLSAADFLLG